jgi:alpha-tubulin suppressor-like RCC1 family protein
LCSDGACKGSAVVCDDGQACTADSCDPTKGCVSLPKGGTCSDGDACTAGDVCSGGACLPGQATDCDDNNPCTTDNCDTKLGCVSAANGLPCSDGDACTNGDGCKNGGCVGPVKVGCDDGNLCTADSCQPAKGCVHLGAAGPCSDSDACTQSDTCSAGTCKAGDKTPCNDGNPCTTDSCDPAKGCVFANNTAACDDLNGCTSGDICQGGACKSTGGCGLNAVCAPKSGGGVACACASGYSGDGQTCTQVCPQGCLTCSGPSVCTQCELGKVIQNGQCVSCTPKACGIGCGKVADGCGATLDCGPCSTANIEAGNGFSCALLYNGSIRCWGANAAGQLGDGSYVDRWQASWVDGTPAIVQGISSAIQLAVGDAHACALLGDGTVQCWGSHSNGQLGDGAAASPTGRTTPVKVSGISNAVQISAGRLHTCAVLSDGTARCWGYNATGQIGDSTTAQRVSPATVQNLAGAKAIGAGYNFTCALLDSGSVKCWGDNYWGQLGDGTLVSHVLPAAVSNLATATKLSVASLGQFACVVLQGQTAQCWGLAANGQLGNGSTAVAKAPVAVSGLTGIQRIDGGNTHTCAVLTDGSVRCWGFNLYGQIGDGSTTNRMLPTLVPGVSGAVDIAAGQDHSCALRSDATVQCWGRNQSGQLGNETTINASSPVAAVHLPCGGSGTSNTCSGCKPSSCQAQKVSSGSVGDNCGGSLVCGVAHGTIALGNGFSCALPGDGGVRCWGQNDKGQLGDGGVRVRYQPTSVDGAVMAVVGVSDAVAIAAGEAHACALLGSGKIRCWGSHAYGQLGTGNAADSVPHFESLEVNGVSGAVGITAGRLHTCAVLADGSAKCWGYNATGQLGDGTAVQRVIPTAVSGLSGVIAVRAGYNFTCALTQTGLVKCWGDSANGQLGSGTLSSLVPRNVAGVSEAVDLTVAPLGQHACALLSAGTALCWGLNSLGQLGDGTTTYRPLAVGVLTLKGATAVQAGSSHTCARLGDGTLKCWGYNLYGQLGDGTTANRSLPTAVSGVGGALQVAGGSTHTCARLQDGSMQCWGHNNFGQLGNETSVSTLTGTAVSHFPCGGGGTSVVCGCTPTTCQAKGVTSGSIADGCGGTLLCGVAAAKLAGGTGFGCAIAGSGSVSCWGSNGKGQLGDGTLTSSTKAVAVKGVAGAVQIAAGDTHACALVGGGAVWCWGSNGNGQLGLGMPVDLLSHAPAPVPGLADAIHISAGYSHTCAALADGSARCWGSNGSGQLGDSTFLQRVAPVSVMDLSGVIATAAGKTSSCALKQNGLVKCWGDNGSGQLGNGNVGATTPMNVAQLSQVASLASGPLANHACALLGNATARCWGSNGNGQLGDNSTTARNLPISVAGLSSAAAISLGTNHSCAISTDGTAKCWGYNLYGQVGDNTTTQRLMATPVFGLNGASSVAAQSLASCFGVAGGGVKCTGYNGTGGLGDTTTVSKSAVVGVVGLP